MLKVYITDLSAYNQGFLIGKWVSLPMAMEDLENELLELYSQSRTCDVNKNMQNHYLKVKEELENLPA